MAKRRYYRKKKTYRKKAGALNRRAAESFFDRNKRVWASKALPDPSSPRYAYAAAQKQKWASISWDQFWAEQNAKRGRRFKEAGSGVAPCSYTNPRTGTIYGGFKFGNGRCWNASNAMGRRVIGAYGRSHLQQPVPVHLAPAVNPNYAPAIDAAGWANANALGIY